MLRKNHIARLIQLQSENNAHIAGARRRLRCDLSQSEIIREKTKLSPEKRAQLRSKRKG